MFRGGRVDARGTGIASGLGYKSGGSVNTPKRGLVNGPGGYGGMGTSGFYDSILGQGLRSVRDYAGKPLLNFINQDIANPLLSLGGYGDLIDRYETPWDDKYLLGLDEKYQKIPDDEYVSYADRYLNKGKGPIETDSGAIPKAIQQQEEVIEKEKFLEQQKNKEQENLEALLGKLNKTDTKEEKLAKIKENEEVFKEVYGSGRADDASAMLLNFAGKALKPEATVKSAFGEFFEEEGKRPSESKKYKDAASQAAIQAYLTGEKSFSDLMKSMELYKYQSELSAKTKKELNDPSNLDWSDRKSYYMGLAKKSDRDSNKIIKYSLQDEKSETGKQVFETTETEWITDPVQAAEKPDGLYIVTPKKGPKRIFEIKEGIVIDRSGDFPT